MRHRHAGRALGRTSSHRKALIRNQITDLLRHERLVTTEAKAKELRPAAERIITLGKRGDLHARRQAAAVLTDRKIVTRLFDELAPRYQNRPGGYTRITKLGPRRGDGAHMAQIELVESGGDAGIMAAPGPAVADSVDDPTEDTGDESNDDTTDELVSDGTADEPATSEDTDEDTEDASDEPADNRSADNDAGDDPSDNDPSDDDQPNETEDT